MNYFDLTNQICYLTEYDFKVVNDEFTVKWYHDVYMKCINDQDINTLKTYIEEDLKSGRIKDNIIKTINNYNFM